MASDTAVRTDAILLPLDLPDEAWDLAETCIRKKTNRHGHVYHRDGTGAVTGETCPDPVAHALDVEDMSRALMAAGLAPYESGGIQTDWGVKPRHGEARSEEEAS